MVATRLALLARLPVVRTVSATDRSNDAPQGDHAALRGTALVFQAPVCGPFVFLTSRTVHGKPVNHMAVITVAVEVPSRATVA